MKYLTIIFFLTLSFSLNAQQTYFVKKDAVGANDGSSWANAFTDLHSALQKSEYGDQIWVASGTWYPTDDTDRSKRFELKNGVKLYGGFSGWETSLAERDWETNKTILSGDIGITGDSTDNSYNILFMMDVDSSTRVDGFYFTGGQADLIYDPVASAGAAIHIDGSQGGFAYPKIHNCTFEYNVAFTGGAVSVNGTMEGSVAPQFYNCTFRFNRAFGTDGGAIARYGGSWEEMPRDFWNCTFFKNEAKRDGGAVYFKDSERTDTIEFRGCHFEENYALRYGGAIRLGLGRVSPSSNTIISNCLFYRNSSNIFGASLMVHASFFGENYFKYFKMDSCLFLEENVDMPSDPELIFFEFPFGSSFDSTSELILTNCVFEKCTGEVMMYFIVSSGNTNTNIVGNSFKENIIDIFMVQLGVLSQDLPSKYPSFHLANLEVVSNFGSANSLVSLSVLYSDVVFANSLIRLNDGFSFMCNIRPLNSNIPPPPVYCSSNIFLENNSPTLSNDNINKGVKMFNSIFTGNSSSFYDSMYIDFSLLDANYCDSTMYPPTCGPNNLFGLDPMFLDTAAGDYRLHPCSPARDAGDNSIIDSLGILTDIAGQPRIQGGVVDMGAWESEAFTIRTDSVQAAPCAGAPGSLWLDLATGCPPFFIALGSDTTISDTSRFQLPLPAGTHTLVITDGRMDTDTLQVTIPGAPPLLASLTATDVLCPGTPGSATLSPLGGTAPYTYLWSNGDTAATATGLPAGLHTVTLTDANGCTLTDSVEIGTSGHLTLGISIQPISCHDSADGIAAITPQDGNWPYSWLWDDGSTDSLRTDIAGGNYSVTVTDALGCTDELSFFLPAPDSLQATASATPPACAGQATGSATANATGGTAPYSYLWSNSSSFQTITNLAPGYYGVTVTDVKGCQDTTGVLVQAPPALSLSIAGATTICPGDSTVLAAQASGGTPPYTYQWNTPGIPPADSSITVGPGNYSLTVVDANGCSKTTSHIVSEDPPIQLLFEVLPVTNPNQPNGAVEVQLTFGGTPPYSYQWSHGPTTASIDSLPPGQYTLTVTDAAGCSETFFFEVLLTSTKNPAAAGLQALIVPNPSGSGGAVLQLQGPWPQHLLLSLHDTHGRLLWQRSVLRSEQISLPQENTPAGSYWLLLRSEQGAVLKGLKWVVVE
ncbi:MAG: hypothetical protein KatS3mg030_115 [Saprospiraceae bacterium]|nr:MAG: hypothetical protein KatS3mg030_115 [Saprospiraceae bacterium]